MSWKLLEYKLPDKQEIKRALGKAKFYADHDIDESIPIVLQHLKYDVEIAREVGAESQPDEFHFRRAFKTNRVLITHDKDYLDNNRFPLSQTRGNAKSD